jgi:hypothetical protein
MAVGLDHRGEPELGRFGDPPVAVADGAKLAGEPKLSKAAQRVAGG